MPINESRIEERDFMRDSAPRFLGSPMVSLRTRQRRFALSRPSTRAESDTRYLDIFSIGLGQEELFAINHISIRFRVNRRRIGHIDDGIVDNGVMRCTIDRSGLIKYSSTLFRGLQIKFGCNYFFRELNKWLTTLKSLK
jgi:hypothetical protein